MCAVNVGPSALANMKSNFHFPSRDPTTVALYVGRPVDVYAHLMIHRTIDGGGVFALYVVESKVPSAAAECTGCDAKVTHVHHTKVGI